MTYIIINFLIAVAETVLAGIVLHYVLKWLDGDQ